MCKTCTSGLCTNGCAAGNTPADTARQKGGRIARAAAMLCQDAQFRLYLDHRSRIKFGLPVADGTHTDQDARDWLLRWCEIQSRAELDHNPAAAKRFHYIRQIYQQYRNRQGGLHT
ncbi:MAG: hypothetical protein OIF57_04590 [Marinobacterium sp.]|nr:hypothetical protein [Marinobacterium sp.]